MADYGVDPKNLENEQQMSAHESEENKITGADIARGAGDLALEFGSDLLQGILSVVILIACCGLGMLIGFFIDGGSIQLMGAMTIILGLVGLVIGFIINFKRGYSVFFY